MPVPQGAMHGGGQPSCFDRVKMGFMMGMCVGMASGGILGGFGALRMGMRGRHDSMRMYRSSRRPALASWFLSHLSQHKTYIYCYICRAGV